MTLEEFLRTSGTIDFRVRATPGENCVSCYIHPDNVNGATIDFLVIGDHVSVIKRLGMLPLDPSLEPIEPIEDPLAQIPFIVCDNLDMKLSDLGINLGDAA